MHALFCYGTLLYPPLLNHLLGGEADVCEACLIGYRCLAVKGEKYPGIVPSAGSSVWGQLVQRVPAGAWHRLDRYEGEFYQRKIVRITLDTGAQAEAWAYVFRQRYSARLAQSAWCYDRQAEHYARNQLQALAASGEPRWIQNR